MTFNAPGRLVLLVAVAALLGLYALAQRRRRHQVVRFTNVDLLASVAPRRPGWRRHLPAAAMLLALTAMVLGFARPTRQDRVARDAPTVVLAIDVSDSMKATDVKPNRITVARGAARTFVKDLPRRFNFGLVAFAGTAKVLVAPTTDRDLALEQLDRLKLEPDTAIGEAIFAALDSIATTQSPPAPGEDPAARIVVLSDGNTTVGRSTEEAARAAAEARIPVSTIAYGSDEGTVMAEGRLLRVPVDRSALRNAAEVTGGTFFEAASGSQLKQVYEDIGTQVELIAERQELTPWFAGLALALGAAAAAMALVWAPRLP
jgi:Ca-activated chloride channel family protein